MQPLLKQLAARFPALTYSVGKQFCWSPETQEIFYRADAVDSKDTWSLLHETGHAVLGHRAYQADFELLQMEIAAWEQARSLSLDFGINIDEDHIQDCLDTYRDWLHQRSVCPNCSAQSMQEADYVHYRCYNCHTVWRVSANRFARTYRKTLFQ
jgi:hypothetical protein